MTWSTYHLLQNDIILLLYCQVDSTLMKIFEKCSRILRDLFQDLWSSWWASQRSMKNPWGSSSGPLKLLKLLLQIYEKFLKIFFRTFQALDNLVKDLWKSLKIFFRTFQALEDLVKDKKTLKIFKILVKIFRDLSFSCQDFELFWGK